MAPADNTLTLPALGMRPREVARLLRVGLSKVLTWIKSGELPAVNTAMTRCAAPRFVILPDGLAAFQRGRQAAQPPKPRRRRRQAEQVVDYFP